MKHIELYRQFGAILLFKIYTSVQKGTQYNQKQSPQSIYRICIEVPRQERFTGLCNDVEIFWYCI